MSESTGSGYDEEEGSISMALHNAAEVGDVNTLERLLGLTDEAGVGLPLGALFRRLVNSTDRNECTPLHVAIIHGHPACVSALLRAHASPSKPCDGGTPLALATCLGLGTCEERAAAGLEIVRALLAAGADPYDKDDGGRTALHWAACSCRTSLVSLLLAGAADIQRSRAAAMAADSAVALPGMEKLLPQTERPEHILAVADHDGFTPLHLAAKFGHAEVVTQLLRAAEESAAAAVAAGEELAKAAAAAAEAVATAEAAAAAKVASSGGAGGGGTDVLVSLAPPSLAELPSAATLASLMPVSDLASMLRPKTRQDGHTALHLAALYGRTAAILEILRALAPGGAVLGPALAAADKKGRTAADLARRRGHVALAEMLVEAAAIKGPPPAGTPAGAAAAPAADAAAPAPPLRTLLLAPEECLLHRTAPEPIVRSDSEPPPENVSRLHVLTNPDTGILHNGEFSDLEWRTSGIPQAAMVDVLRCHDWSYVRRVIQACDAIVDSPVCVGSLDHDTAISRHTMRAALVAAGAVCAAVDEVVAGRVRNAFCAVRPPGHHAGPCGIVTNPNDSHGSHGFCILSNVAIGAAYAMAVHRHAGIRRVAIVDFDVHHGNGTQACVLNTAPSIRTLSLRTPYSDGQQHFPVYKPWLGDGDAHNIFFASVQGFGRRGSSGGWFYPGSGATADSTIVTSLKPPGKEDSVSPATAATTTTTAAASGGGTSPEGTAAAAAAAGLNAAAAAAANAAASANGAVAAVVNGNGAPTVATGTGIPEDPDGEFRGSYDVTVVGGPRIINVGIPGPGGKPRMWRRAWRDKILPALANFKPDIILVSAGFDAHKKEDLNLRYVGVTEADYEWLTGQIVEVANACCMGRVVSVLEGGYNLRGGPLGSAFARSVAAHVRALAAPCIAKYEPLEAEAERAAEKALEARKAAKAAALAAGIIPPASLATPRSSLPTPRAFPADVAVADGGNGAAPMDTDPEPGAAGTEGRAVVADATAGAAPTDSLAAPTIGEEPPAKRRRRPVDYAALNAQIEKEQQEPPAREGATYDGVPP
ncbi:hypothetical protein VaNZ11_008553, partial [Volvox africanus]